MVDAPHRCFDDDNNRDNLISGEMNIVFGAMCAKMVNLGCSRELAACIAQVGPLSRVQKELYAVSTYHNMVNPKPT